MLLLYNIIKVKDASPNETIVEPTIGNSFKVTIKSSDPFQQSRFVFDNLNSKQNIQKDDIEDMQFSSAVLKTQNNRNEIPINKNDFCDAVSKSSGSSYENQLAESQLCIADFSRNANFNFLESKKLPKNSQSNSNNSTIVINSLSPASSSSLSNMPIRGSFNDTNFVGCKILPSTTSSALSASNTIKFILNSQISATNQRNASIDFDHVYKTCRRSLHFLLH